MKQTGLHWGRVSEQTSVCRVITFILPAASLALVSPTPAAHVAGQMTDD